MRAPALRINRYHTHRVMMMRSTGNRFEALACQWLQAKGLALLTRNFTTRHGEIDIIMRDGADIVFVEVRFRRSARCGSAVDTVTASKRDKLVKAAAQWLASHPQHAQRACRFDVVCFEGLEHDARPVWWKHAFDAD